MREPKIYNFICFTVIFLHIAKKIQPHLPACTYFSNWSRHNESNKTTKFRLYLLKIYRPCVPVWRWKMWEERMETWTFQLDDTNSRDAYTVWIGFILLLSFIEWTKRQKIKEVKLIHRLCFHSFCHFFTKRERKFCWSSAADSFTHLIPINIRGVFEFAVVPPEQTERSVLSKAEVISSNGHTETHTHLPPYRHTT